MVIVFLKLGKRFFIGLDIYRWVEESFQAVLKYLFSNFLSLPSSYMIMRFFY